MASIKSYILNALSGKFSGVQFRTRKNGLIEISATHSPRNPNTPDQSKIRNFYTAAYNHWQFMTNDEKADYTDPTEALPPYQNFMKIVLTAGVLPMAIHDDTQHRDSAKRDNPFGVAPLDALSRIPVQNLPPLAALQNTYPNYSTHIPTPNKFEEFGVLGAGVATTAGHRAVLSLNNTDIASSTYVFSTPLQISSNERLAMSATIHQAFQNPNDNPTQDIGFCVFPHNPTGNFAYEGIFMRQNAQTASRTIIVGNDDDDETFTIPNGPTDNLYHNYALIIHNEDIEFFTDGVLDISIPFEDCNNLPPIASNLFPAVRLNANAQQNNIQTINVDYMGYAQSPI